LIAENVVGVAPDIGCRVADIDVVGHGEAESHGVLRREQRSQKRNEQDSTGHGHLRHEIDPDL
jgi:hypothetical protein